jgi:hypothetical protein
VKRALLAFAVVGWLLPQPCGAQTPASPGADHADVPVLLSHDARDYFAAANEVTRYIQKTFYLSQSGLYAHSTTQRHAEYMWGNGVMFSALLGAARHDPQTYLPIVNQYFKSMDRYWDTAVKIPGYEPAPTSGGGNDKYYDDNAWMVLGCTEAFEMTHNQQYLDRAQQTLGFVMSGWDMEGGGGSWGHVAHKGGGKNTCVNAPAAVGCLRIAHYLPTERSREMVDMAKKIMAWTDKTLRAEDGLYYDSISLKTGKINTAKLTYNSALMLRAYLGLYTWTHNSTDLAEAQKIGRAADWFLGTKTHAYRDSVKWSHLMIEADLQLYRTTHEEYLLKRAISNADYEFATWKKDPSPSLIDNAAVARTLWLMADMQSVSGEGFWRKLDHRNETQ